MLVICWSCSRELLSLGRFSTAFTWNVKGKSDHVTTSRDFSRLRVALWRFYVKISCFTVAVYVRFSSLFLSQSRISYKSYKDRWSFTKHLDPQSAHWLCKAWNRSLLYLVLTKTTLICSRAERWHSWRERQNSSGKRKRSLGSKWKERYVDADSLIRNKPLLWRMIVTHSTETFRKHRHATKKIIWKLLKMGWL